MKTKIFLFLITLLPAIVNAQWEVIKPTYSNTIYDLKSFKRTKDNSTTIFIIEKPSTLPSYTYQLSYSTDFGINWQNSKLEDIGWTASTLFIRKKGDEIYDFLIGTIHGLMRSTDIAQGWSKFDQGIPSTNFVEYIGTYSVHPDSLPNLFVSTFMSGPFGWRFPTGIYWLDDKTNTWNKAASYLEDNVIPRITASIIINEKTNGVSSILACSSNNDYRALIKSTDKGVSWINCLNKYKDYTFTNFYYVYNSETNSKELIATASNRGVLKSTDEGTTWLAVNNQPFVEYGFTDKEMIVLTAPNSSTSKIIAATGKDYRLYSSSDLGNSWQFLDNSLLSFATGDYKSFINGLLVADKHIFVTSSERGAWRRPLSDLITEVKQQEMPVNYSLSQNYPNPFNPSTTINYQLSTPGFVTLKVYDLLGREVATLVDEYKQAGIYNCKLRIENGELPSGIYFYRLQSGSYSETKKLILMK